jgi:ABC-type Fe3+ transport system substrate-binding protein
MRIWSGVLGSFTVAAMALSGVASTQAADAALIEAAKKEGSAVWYTTQIIDPLVLAVAAGFQKKYGVKLDYVRANSNEIALRLIEEGKAGSVKADVYDGTTTAEVLKKAGLALKWLPDSAKTYTAEHRDPDGYWVATNDYLITAAFNTNMIKPGEEPTTWEALLDPRWRGQVVWGSTPSTSAGAGFVGTVLKQWGPEKGRDFLKKFSGQKVASVGAAARVVIDQVIAGEYAIAMQIFPEHAIVSAQRGAPIRWIPMKPAMTGIVSTTGVLAKSPHPNAGKLLLDYLCDEEGQALYRDAFYIPAHPKVPPVEAELTPGKHRAIYQTPTEANDAMPGWFAIYKELFQ